MKIFITAALPDIAVRRLREAGFKTLVYGGFNPSAEEYRKYAFDADALICLLSDKITPEIIDSIPGLKIIANYAVGYNNIDTEYAASSGIIVTNTPDILTDATADLAFALILACARNVVVGDKFLREGKFDGWKPKLLLGKDLKGKTLGIIGAGRIGAATAERAAAFGMNILYYSRSENKLLEKSISAVRVELDKLMRESDVVSLHIPLTENTKNLLDASKLDLMKKDAILVNTARGETLDEQHLIKMLKEKRLFSAGFDVYVNEPDINHKLIELENAVLLPHLGSATFDTRDRMALLAAENVINVLTGKAPVTPV